MQLILSYSPATCSADSDWSLIEIVQWDLLDSMSILHRTIESVVDVDEQSMTVIAKLGHEHMTVRRDGPSIDSTTLISITEIDITIHSHK